MTTHTYFTAKAREVFAKAGGNPDHSAALAEWAEAVRPTRDMALSVVVAEDGTLVALERYCEEPFGVSARYVVEALVPEAQEVVGRVSDMARARLCRVLGQNVIGVTYSDVCVGARPVIQAA